MSVLLETSLGDIVVDLFVDKCPLACENFIKLCKIKFYNNSLFLNVEKDYLCKIGSIGVEPTSIYSVINGEEHRYFKGEVQQDLKLNRKGLLGTANLGPDLNHSEFFITLTDSLLPALTGKHSIFGVVAEGLDILDKVNKIYVDKEGRPLANIRIFHTLILDDPIPDPKGLVIPENSPLPILNSSDRLDIDTNMNIIFDNKQHEGELIEEIKRHKAKTNAIVLETLEDLPDADIKPPENVLFICKLNPVTTERDLEIIFSSYGPIKRCDVVRDWKTGQSLQYAFIEYETKAACEEAYNKMENALIDERRIHVDFCQSVAKIWKKHFMRQNDIRDEKRKNRQNLESLSSKSSKFRKKYSSSSRSRSRSRSDSRRHKYR